MFLSKQYFLLFSIALGVSLLHAAESMTNEPVTQADTIKLFAEVFSDIAITRDEANKEDAATKSQSLAFKPSSASSNVKPVLVPQLQRLEQEALLLQQNYLVQLSQFEQKASTDRAALEKQFLDALRAIHAQIKELSKK